MIKYAPTIMRDQYWLDQQWCYRICIIDRYHLSMHNDYAIRIFDRHPVWAYNRALVKREKQDMSFATSQPIVNRYVSAGDVATALRTHLLANVSNQKADKLRTVANAVAATVKVHPVRLARIMRRGAAILAVLDLVN